MDRMLTEICAELNNYFWRQKITGEFTIEGGAITVPLLQDGQYFRIVGSVFNDGVHQYPATDLKDETFTGAVWTMAVPEAVIVLASEISDWLNKYGETVASPFNSESFGNYSYSKGSITAGSAGNPNTWQAVFSARLNKWRRLRGAR